MFLLAAAPDGTPRMVPLPTPEQMVAPEGAAPATCQGCRQPIYRRPDGVWTLGRPPWFCFPDNELVGVLAQLHAPWTDAEGDAERPATIYRWYGRHAGRDDVLLYIGQTGGGPQRPTAHRSKAWWGDVQRGTIEHVPAADVLRLERAAIEAERPVYNIIGNPRPAGNGQ
jgi:hypothetical protein